jgi:hypothetical protein
VLRSHFATCAHFFFACCTFSIFFLRYACELNVFCLLALERTCFSSHARSAFFACAGARAFCRTRVQHSFACVTLLARAGARWSARVQQSLAFHALFCLTALAKSFGFLAWR